MLNRVTSQRLGRSGADVRTSGPIPASIVLTPRRALAGLVATIAVGVFLGLIFCATFRVGVAQQPFNSAAYIYAWNDVADSIDKQNPLLNEIQENVKRSSPAHVRDARRAQLWDAIIAEHERQLKDFKTLRRLEQ